jgi:hypothetical protein
MANFSAYVLYNGVGTVLKTGGILWGGGTKRAQIYEVELGQFGVYASQDAAMLWDLSRAPSTAGMTGTTLAANLLDPADYVAATLFMNAATAEPTNYTTGGLGLNLKQWGINQRGSYRWRALDDGDNIILPASASALGLRCASLTSGYAASAVGTISFIER